MQISNGYLTKLFFQNSSTNPVNRQKIGWLQLIEGLLHWKYEGTDTILVAGQQQANWNEADNTKPDFIKNKPASYTGTLSVVTDLSTTPPTTKTITFTQGLVTGIV